ncbi:hypothetical protein Hanom_Chr09g00846521 [Helianthus anomalus]
MNKSGPIDSGPMKKSDVAADSVKLGAEKNLGSTDLRGPNVGTGNILKNKIPLKSMVDNLSERSKGSRFLDVSKNDFGSRQSPKLETKNTFGMLQDKEECYDTEFGLWEKEMFLVRKYYETNICPPVDVFSSWSDKMKAYYVMLTKFDPVNEAMVETSVENEVEVESKTDESARDIVRGL